MDKDIEDKIIQLRLLKDMTIMEISEELGIPKTTVWRVLKKHGIKKPVTPREPNYICSLCGKGFDTDSLLVKHIKEVHMGKLSKGSFEYLKSLGVQEDKIIEYCQKNKIRLML